MEYFVNRHSIVQKIWGKGDTILFIFAGAAAEFALNKAVDWLYFTGRLPEDPLGRLFSTVGYARKIIFAEEKAALKAIDAMAAIHVDVETSRGAKIPDWAYRDVLFMLIDYSIRAFEILERKMNFDEKQEVFDVFYRMGTRMGVKDLPQTYTEWKEARQSHLLENLVYSSHTKDLFNQYNKHLGMMRYRILLEAQILIVPQKVKELLSFRKNSLLQPIIGVYKFSRLIKLDGVIKSIFLPNSYMREIKALDVYHV